jgi:hypothetical protein
MDTLWQPLQIRWNSALPGPSGSDCAFPAKAKAKQAIDPKLKMHLDPHF